MASVCQSLCLWVPGSELGDTANKPKPGPADYGVPYGGGGGMGGNQAYAPVGGGYGAPRGGNNYNPGGGGGYQPGLY